MSRFQKEGGKKKKTAENLFLRISRNGHLGKAQSTSTTGIRNTLLIFWQNISMASNLPFDDINYTFCEDFIEWMRGKTCANTEVHT